MRDFALPTGIGGRTVQAREKVMTIDPTMLDSPRSPPPHPRNCSSERATPQRPLPLRAQASPPLWGLVTGETGTQNEHSIGQVWRLFGRFRKNYPNTASTSHADRNSPHSRNSTRTNVFHGETQGRRIDAATRRAKSLARGRPMPETRGFLGQQISRLESFAISARGQIASGRRVKI